ncbi:MAG: hypothetical protein KGO96_05790 [Elusimicrobia bacterium]|nr:hypothetical protein [Elusimicrobiota bacterium]MDE2236328.1 hypothetical protein [Elusimicrobiota bacterium]MDE2425401.1 hypothetical protein [Elusimicrobiota bacterium]
MLAAAPAASAQTVSSGTLRLALLEEPPLRVSTELGEPLEHLLKRRLSSGCLAGVWTLPAEYSGGGFRLDLPDPAPAAPERIPAMALESNSNLAYVYPPLPGLIAALSSAAGDPSSWNNPWSVRLSTRAVTLSLSRGARGQASLSAEPAPSAFPAPWRKTIAELYRLRWNGRDASVLIVSRVYGGMPGFAAAVRQEAAKGPLLGVSRGGLFSSFQTGLEGQKLTLALQALGLRYSALGDSELHHWGELEDYRRAHPAGVQFLSANLVYSSDTAHALLPASAVVTAGGLRVAFVGLTPPSAAKYLRRAGLAGMTIADPVETLESLLPRLRQSADAVVVLMEYINESPGLAETRGVDLLIGHYADERAARAPNRSIEQKDRQPFQPPLWVMDSYDPSFNWLEAEITLHAGLTDWSLRERHLLLDDSVPEAPGFVKFDPEDFGLSLSTGTALIPSAREIFPDSPGSFISSRRFWTLAAGLAAEKTGCELGLLRVWHLVPSIEDAVNEQVVRLWLKTDEPAYTLLVKGRQLKPLLERARRQAEQEAKGMFRYDALRFAFGGLQPDDRGRDGTLYDDEDYKVVTTQVVADALGLSQGRTLTPVGRTVGRIVLAALRSHSDAAPSAFGSWMEGAPIVPRGLWLLDFRDVGLDLQQTRVVRDDAFNDVPNSRIQGFDELLIGGEAKVDAEYLRQPFRWKNTVELEYARSRLRPRDQPPVSNTTANRIMVSTLGSWTAGGVRAAWLGRQWGPSLGLQYDGQFEPDPGLPRKQIYSLLPGVSLFDGSWIKSLDLSGNVKRDLSRSPPNTQLGFHERLLLSHAIGGGPAALDGELYTNYFFLTQRDTDQDLRVEGDLNLKLRVPIRKYLTVAPFLDFYYFALKTRPLWGYSSMIGVQLGFSRLWKPRYESLLGER